jgi:hypothetical protein
MKETYGARDLDFVSFLILGLLSSKANSSVIITIVATTHFL